VARKELQDPALEAEGGVYGDPVMGLVPEVDLNPDPASAASDPIHSSTENTAPSTYAPVDREEHADGVRGHFGDSPDHLEGRAPVPAKSR
jgi:hypothetical protein